MLAVDAIVEDDVVFLTPALKFETPGGFAKFKFGYKLKLPTPEKWMLGLSGLLGAAIKAIKERGNNPCLPECR